MESEKKYRLKSCVSGNEMFTFLIVHVSCTLECDIHKIPLIFFHAVLIYAQIHLERFLLIPTPFLIIIHEYENCPVEELMSTLINHHRIW